MTKTKSHKNPVLAALLLFTVCLSLSWDVSGQDRLIRGAVVDAAEGDPLARVTVTVKGTKVATLTNNEGKFSVQAKRTDTLAFSFTGYNTVLVAVGNKTMIEVTLEPTNGSLGEVIVIGYGAVKKTDLTGSVGQVKVAEMTKAPLASFTEGLAGRVAGVRVSSSDGQPGVQQDIIIRGASSLTQSNAPLYVVDGFPVEDLASAAVSPSDIESINILKDASATAIYGARGANGVVVIETKRGKAGKAVINFNASYGGQKMIKKMDMMNAYEFVKYQEEMNISRGTPEFMSARYYVEGQTLESYKDRETTNWQDKVLRTGKVQTYDIAMRGGNAQTRYAVSGSAYKQDGILLNTNYDRYQGRITLDHNISPKLKTGVTANYGSIKAFGLPVAAYGSTTFVNYFMFQMLSYRPVVGSSTLDLTNEIVDAIVINTNDVRFNPISSLNNDYNLNRTNDLMASAYLQYALTKDISIRLAGSLNRRTTGRDIFYNTQTPNGSPLNPRNTRGVNGSTLSTALNIWNNENTITYNKAFNASHTLTVLGGFSMQGVKSEIDGFAAQFLPNENLGISGLDEGLPYQGTSAKSENALISFFGRLNYAYQSKYLLTATFRGDGSSKFATGNKWGYFPSAALAWNMTKESFMKSIPVISTSKLRLSYGVTGNNRVSDFPYLASLGLATVNSYSFNNQTPTQGTTPNTPANYDLRWETTKTWDLGYDLGLFNNRIELTVDLYRKTTTDLLLNADMPRASGYDKVFKNIGSLRNDGLEITLSTTNIRNKDFTWQSSFNISFNNNKIMALTRNQEVLFAGGNFIGTNNWISQVGGPAGMMYGWAFDGIFQYEDFDSPSPGNYILKKDRPDNGNARATIKPGDIRYKDFNGDGTVNDLDQVIIGRGQPIHTGGFTNNFLYKGFDLNIFLQWSYGNDIFNVNRFFFEGSGNYQIEMNQYKSYVNRWSPTNPSNTMFRAGGQGPLSRFSSRLIEDGSYLRLKNIALGYNIPPRLLRKLYLSQLKVNVTAQNLLTWTNYSGIDPEVSIRGSVLTPGMDFSAYPQARTFSVSLNATF